MIKGTRDNVLDVVKYLEQQKLQYVLAVWSPSKDDKSDDVSIYTSFEKNEMKRLCEVLKKAEPPDENNNKI